MLPSGRVRLRGWCFFLGKTPPVTGDSPLFCIVSALVDWSDTVVSSDRRQSLGPRRYGVVLGLAWTLAVVGAFSWSCLRDREATSHAARVSARAQFTKDVIYRRWNAGHGGVYVPVTDSNPPNPFLKQVDEREVTTPSGRVLTLVNPAYMTRQVHELGMAAEGVRGHITSLKPIRPANAPDVWERQALERFNVGEKEFSSIETVGREEHLRLMRPLRTEKGCLKCHAQQGYREGDVRGGISVSIPMEPYVAIGQRNRVVLGVGHCLLWLFGLVGIGLTGASLQRHERERDRAEVERDQTIEALQDALAQIKTLRGIVPICSQCKRIRDDEGYWEQLDIYVREHVEAEFTHGICPDCVKELYPDEANRILAAMDDEASEEDVQPGSG